MDILSLGECYQWSRQMDAHPAMFGGWQVLRIERLLPVSMGLTDFITLDEYAVSGDLDLALTRVTVERWGLLLSHHKTGRMARATSGDHLAHFPARLDILPLLDRPAWPGNEESAG